MRLLLAASSAMTLMAPGVMSSSIPYFWKKPWRRKFFDWGVERVYPWACMGCGVVLLYLDRLPAIAEEYKTAREPENAPKIVPAPLGS